MERRKFINISCLLLLAVIICITFYSCAKDKGEPVIYCNSLPDTVSFNKNVIPIFKANCSLSGCHSGSTPTGSLDLDSSSAYSQLMRKNTSYVDTLDAKNSLLYSQLVSTSNPMPPTGSINYCSIQLILKWIQQKAKND